MPATNVAWGGATLTIRVSGTDVTCDMMELTVDRSKNRVWDPPDAGVCQVTLNLSAGGVPTTTGVVGAFVDVRIAYGGIGRYLFTGQVQLRRLAVRPEGDVLVLSCVDGFERLARLNRRTTPGDVAVGDGEAIQQRIARWLDTAGWSAPRALTSSDFTTPATFLEGNVLTEIQRAALADGGDFYIDGAGVATFRSWNWQAADNQAMAVFSDRLLNDWVPYSNADLNEDLDEVQNKVYGTRRAINDTDTPVTQLAQNPSSITAYGERGDALDELELKTDGQVATRVSALVSVAAGPNQRFDSVVVQPAFDPARSWPRTIPVTFGSLIGANRIWEDGTQTALYAHVIGEQWTITPDDITVEFRCEGTGTWDAIRAPRPPLRLERCPDGTLRVPDGYPCDQTATVIIKDAAGNVLATYPPGSLCNCGTVTIPDGGVEICLDDGVHPQTCVDIPQSVDYLLWFDVLEPGPNLIERVDGDAVAHGAGWGAVRLDVIPGDYDAIDANTTGGVIGTSHSDHVAAAAISTGWRVEFWLYLAAHLPGATTVYVFQFDTIWIGLTTTYQATGPYITELEITTLSGGVQHRSGPVHQLAIGGWHKYIVSFDASAVGAELVVIVDGAVV